MPPAISTVSASFFFTLENLWQQPCPWALLKSPSHFNQHIYIYTHIPQMHTCLSLELQNEMEFCLLKCDHDTQQVHCLSHPSSQFPGNDIRSREHFKRTRETILQSKERYYTFLYKSLYFWLEARWIITKNPYFFIKKEKKSYRSMRQLYFLLFILGMIGNKPY